MAARSNIKAGSAYVAIYTDQTALARGLKKAQMRLKAFGTSVTSYGRSLVKASALILAPAAMGIKTLISYDDQMRELQAVTKSAAATAEGAAADFVMLDDKIRQLGRTTSYTATQVAAGATELGRAGFEPKEINDTIDAVLNLGKATRTELGPAATYVADTLRAFRLETSKASDVADTMFVTTTLSTQGMDSLGEALKYVGPYAVEAGESLADTAAAIAVLANNGIKGSMAGRSLRMAYQKLVDPGSISTLKSLGVEVIDQAGNLRKVADIIGELGDATKDMGTGARMAVFAKLFGARAAGAALKLAGSEDFREMQGGLKDISGAVAKASAEMEAGPGGAWRRMLSAIESMFIDIGKSIAGTFDDITVWIKKAATAIESWVKTNRGLVKSFTQIALIVAGAGFALVGLGTIFHVAAFATGALSTALWLLVLPLNIVLGTASAIATVFAFLLSPIGLVSLALVAIGAIILNVTQIGQEFADSAIAAFRSIGEVFGQVWGGIVDALKAGDIKLAGRIAFAGLKTVWFAALIPIKEAWYTLMAGLGEAWTAVSTVFKKAWGVLKYMWFGLVSTLRSVWYGFMAALKLGFWGTLELLARGMAYFARKMGFLLSKIPGVKKIGIELINTANTAVAYVADKRRGALGTLRQQKAGEETYMAGKRKDLGASFARIDKQNQDASAAMWGFTDGKIAAARKRHSDAQKELDAATAEAAKKAGALGTDEYAKPWWESALEASGSGKGMPTGGQIGQAIADATSRGAFSLTSGLLALQSGGAAKAQEQTAENTKQIAESTAATSHLLDQTARFA